MAVPFPYLTPNNFIGTLLPYFYMVIQRGADVEVPAAVAEVLRHSEEMDNAANAKIEAAQAAAQNVPALQKL